MLLNRSRSGRSRCLSKSLVAFVLSVGLSAGCQPDASDSELGNQTVTSKAEKDDPVERMNAAIRDRDWQRADKYTKEVMVSNPDDPDLLTKIATVSAFCGRKREAAILLVDAAKLAGYQPKSRVSYAIQTLVDVGEIYPAIDLLESSLQSHPEDNDLRRILVGFLSEAQRTDKLQGPLKVLIQNRSFDLPLLISTSDTSTRRLSERTSKLMMERNPNDHRIRLAEAFVSLYRRDAMGAVSVLEDILHHHPDFAPAHAMYGQALSAAARWRDLPQWLESAPSGSDEFADYWLTMGDLARENGQPAEATRAYWEATRRDPNRNDAWDRLRLSIQSLQKSDAEYRDRVSDEVLQVIDSHANDLLTFGDRFNDFAADGQDSQTAATKVAQSLVQLGRLWEAEAWSAIATTLPREPSDQLTPLRREIVGRLRPDSGWFAKDTPAYLVDLSFLPLLKVESNWEGPKRNAVVPLIAAHDHLRMTNSSDQWGLKSIGEGNNPTNAKLAALIRSTGVGGGAIDYDLDGLPDLLMMNAGGTMLKSDSKPNDLMRNVGTRFVRVSNSTGVGDKGFGQGVAVGDFNEDGFADLFFANLGSSRLLRNNGDGTFSDCTDTLLNGASDAWSTSASFVDINQDAIADLFVTSYCKTVPSLDKACPNNEGVLGPCHPLKFPADTDQFFVGTPEGRLVKLNADWIDHASPGRGLGIVSGMLDGIGLGIFVANDMSRNALYSRDQGSSGGESSSKNDGDSFRLIEHASASGVAVDGTSRAQASMGIASSDFDLDGDLDFYVTGFAREYNIYYEQISPGLWKDETAKFDLVQPTLMMVGFGAAAIDLDSDGVDEIIVTNGHIGEFSDPEAPPYELPLQIFRRDPSGGFVLLDDDAWGDYFSTPHVGRALWTTDVNRDGRNDVMITHTHEQVRLLINESNDSNDRIAFKLVATDCSRDAVGAVIRFNCNDKPRTLWMLSGDGYFCSSEKTLIAGLGQAEHVSDLSVTWQDGSVDTIGKLEANAEYIIVQGEGKAFPLQQYAD